MGDDAREQGVRTVRPPAVAGTFYPASARALRRAVRGYLEPVSPESSAPAPKAIIAPHAGYVYSGPVAASAYARVAALRARVERVVLVGPAHRVRLRGLAAPRADAFETPLGAVAIDDEYRARVAALPQVAMLDEPHAFEHSLEVQLPFLQVVLDDFRLLPLVVGAARAQEVAEVLDAVWGGSETLVVVSSDLSHYHDYATARELDAATSAAIERLDPDGLGRDSACGRIAIGGLLVAAHRRGLHAETLDVRSSGDTAGSRDSVVGYGAYAFSG